MLDTHNNVNIDYIYFLFGEKVSVSHQRVLSAEWSKQVHRG